MPRYSFDKAGGEVRTDGKGSELADDATAQCKAGRLAGASTCD